MQPYLTATPSRSTSPLFLRSPAPASPLPAHAEAHAALRPCSSASRSRETRRRSSARLALPPASSTRAGCPTAPQIASQLFQLPLPTRNHPNRFELELSRELPSLLGHVSPPARNLQAYVGVHQAGGILGSAPLREARLFRIPFRDESRRRNDFPPAPSTLQTESGKTTSKGTEEQRTAGGTEEGVRTASVPLAVPCSSVPQPLFLGVRCEVRCFPESGIRP